MRSRIFFTIIFLLVSALAFNKVVRAQDTTTPETQPPTVKKPEDARGNALRQLGLSPEQMQQIRRVNMERKPLMEAAQKRFREANRLLDEAIYSDQANDADVQAHLKEVHLAQAEVVRIRFMNEFAVRRILTPEQLVQFRELRRKFEQEHVIENNNRKLNGERRINNDPNPPKIRPLREVKQQLKQNTRANPQRH